MGADSSASEAVAGIGVLETGLGAILLEVRRSFGVVALAAAAC
jgi:hypothetical protein